MLIYTNGRNQCCFKYGFTTTDGVLVTISLTQQLCLFLLSTVINLYEKELTYNQGKPLSILYTYLRLTTLESYIALHYFEK